MMAYNCELGEKFKSIITGHIWMVEIIDSEKYFVDQEYGDISENLHDNYFNQI